MIFLLLVHIQDLKSFVFLLTCGSHFLGKNSKKKSTIVDALIVYQF